ncbi:uncharacterized protein [Rutidosis leptorrhynchoides]|uniref:uncharacterized protein n=1 Tax=Rutidosis leptorrhynchoides TaxID=125765 RepID=UPI003A99DA5C
MPLVRFQTRNEYCLGQSDMYKLGETVNNGECSKQLLDGVSAVGLVGILRQLGDLAEFGAEIFHGIQEQVTSTSSRSQRLMVRLHKIEAQVTPMETTVLAQKSHIEFAYTDGSKWHRLITNEQNQFIYNDMPKFILDSYEECRDPPRLHLLDKFDTGGPGSCLRRYSDPTFFRRKPSVVAETDAEKDNMVRLLKKKSSSQKNGEISKDASISNQEFASSNVNGSDSPSQMVSVVGDNFSQSSLHEEQADCAPSDGSYQLEEIESEPEDYEDALISIESDSETDFPDKGMSGITVDGKKQSETHNSSDNEAQTVKSDEKEDEIQQSREHSSEFSDFQVSKPRSQDFAMNGVDQTHDESNTIDLVASTIENDENSSRGVGKVTNLQDGSRSKQANTYLKEIFGSELHSPSPSSSPPLELMKISFNPISTSRLKLGFPEEGSMDSRETRSRNTFPSFQLIPETSTLMNDMTNHSDSDDETTFSPNYTSDDDSVSHHDQHWESAEASVSNSLSKMSSESFSTSPASANKELEFIDRESGDESPLCSPSIPDNPNEEIVNIKPHEKAANSKGVDEKEDFLHEIRTKSFNLRPTATSTSSTNVKIKAILKKANSIRQAVASDDSEDDDNWK